MLLGALGLNMFKHLWTDKVSFVFPSPTLVPLVVSKFQAEDVTGQFRLLILVAPSWMKAPWLPTALNMLEGIPDQFPNIKI